MKQDNLETFMLTENEDTISFSDLILKLARQVKIVIITPIILCLFMIVYVLYFAETIYISDSKIMSSSNVGTASQASGIAAQFGIKFPTNASEPNWVYEDIIKSRTLAKAVLKDRFDTDKFGLQKTLLQILTHGNEQPKTSIDTLESLAIEKFIGMIDVIEDIKTGIITLYVSSFEPRLSSEISKRLIEQLDNHQRNYNKQKTSDTRKFIEERIVDTEKELMSSEEDLKIFRDRNRRIENSPALQLEQQRLIREVTVLTGVFTTLKQQLETTKIEEVKESDYVVILDAPNVPLWRSKPKKKLLVLLTGLFGIGLGLVLALIRDYMLNIDEEKREKIITAKTIITKNVLGLVPEFLNIAHKDKL